MYHLDMADSGVFLVWECKLCDAKGTVVFAQGETVGRRLRECEESHRKHDPNCKLDWDYVVVREYSLSDAVFSVHPRASY